MQLWLKKLQILHACFKRWNGHWTRSSPLISETPLLKNKVIARSSKQRKYVSRLQLASAAGRFIHLTYRSLWLTMDIHMTSLWKSTCMFLFIPLPLFIIARGWKNKYLDRVVRHCWNICRDVRHENPKNPNSNRKLLNEGPDIAGTFYSSASLLFP